jgi:CP family cyanate transporter-like MFS transporter
MPLTRLIIYVALLWLAGVSLRLTVLAVPPLIRLIHDDLHLSETQVGILSGLPLVLFALAAVPGSLLIARMGALPTLIAGLLIAALASALRGAASDVWLLYAMTVVMGFGISVMQPALPPLVRAWLPQRVGFGTAVYANGLLVGEIFPVALMMPLVLPLVGGSWRLAFVAWAVPCVVIALIILALAPRSAAAEPSVPRRWWPDWKSALIWRLGLMFGSVNSVYFATNAFIPDFLHHAGRPDLISATLSALNIGQLPAALILLVYADRLVGRVWPYLACGMLSLASILGMLFGPGWLIVASAGALGFCGAAVLVFMLALPPLLSAPDDIHRMTAAMFTISYSCAVIVPVISGLAWDATAVPAAAFIPIGLCPFVLMGLAPSILLHRDAVSKSRTA